MKKDERKRIAREERWLAIGRESQAWGGPERDAVEREERRAGTHRHTTINGRGVVARLAGKP